MNIFQKINEAISSNRGIETLDTNQLDIIALVQSRGFRIKSIKPINCSCSAVTSPRLPANSITDNVGNIPFYSSAKKVLFYGDLFISMWSDGSGNDEFTLDCYEDANTSNEVRVFYGLPNVTENKQFLLELRKQIFSTAQITNTIGNGSTFSFSGYIIEIY